MPSEVSTPLVTTDQSTAQKVAKAIESDDRLAPIFVCSSIEDLSAHLDTGACPTAIVDIDPEPLGMLSELVKVIARHPGTRMVVLCSSLKTDLILEAMQTGARQFLQKDTIETELVPTLRRLVEHTAPAYTLERGSVITVLSASGGSGATTVAVNVANDLQLTSSSTVLLVDMDLSYGAIATYLGLHGSYGIADVLAQGPSVDAQLVRSCALTFTQGLHVLLSPASLNAHAPGSPAYENLPRAMEACREAYKYTIVDAPHIPTDLAANLAITSQMVLIVLQMTVKDIHYARDLRSALVHAGVAPSHITCVVNRYRKRNPMVSFKECKQALGEDNLEIVRNDFKSAVRSINFGKPLSEAAPMSAIRKDLKKLAEKIARVHARLSMEEDSK